MKLSELEQVHADYLAAEVRIQERVGRREFPTVLDECRAALQHLGPAVQFRRRRQITPETPPLTPLDVILTYAPPLFEHAVLLSLMEWLKASRRILASHPTNYSELAKAALVREDLAREAWNHIERQPGLLLTQLIERHPTARKDVQETLTTWEKLGIVICERTGSEVRLSLRTRLDEEMEAVCPACGVHGRGKKEILWRNTICKKCGASGHYHLICPIA